MPAREMIVARVWSALRKDKRTSSWRQSDEFQASGSTLASRLARGLALHPLLWRRFLKPLQSVVSLLLVHVCISNCLPLSSGISCSKRGTGAFCSRKSREVLPEEGKSQPPPELPRERLTVDVCGESVLCFAVHLHSSQLASSRLAFNCCRLLRVVE